MNDTLSGLGKIIDSPQERDAVHIAVAPVVASENMAPGNRICFTAQGDTENVRLSMPNDADAIGIVDPFLRNLVLAGEKFWMFLLPNTITSLRHDWTHPDFDSVEGNESRRWIEVFAAQLDQTYNRLMEAADLWDHHKEYTFDNSERYKVFDHDKWGDFWDHYEIVTGKKVEDASSFFTCSC
jgi:hypothetical protein